MPTSTWSPPPVPNGSSAALEEVVRTLKSAGQLLSDSAQGVKWVAASMSDWRGKGRDACDTAVGALTKSFSSTADDLAPFISALDNYAQTLATVKSKWQAANDWYEGLINPPYCAEDQYIAINGGQVWLWSPKPFTSTVPVLSAPGQYNEPYEGGFMNFYDPGKASEYKGWVSQLEDAASRVNAASSSVSPKLGESLTGLKGNAFAATSYSVPISKNLNSDSVIPWVPSTVIVNDGDSLWAIAQKLYGNGEDYTKILAANPKLGGNPDTIIYPGESLVFPAAGLLAIGGAGYLAVNSSAVQGMLSKDAAAEGVPSEASLEADGVAQTDASGTVITVGSGDTTDSDPDTIASTTLNKIFDSPGTTGTIQPNPNSSLGTVNVTQVAEPGSSLTNTPGTGPVSTKNEFYWKVSVPGQTVTYKSNASAEAAIASYLKGEGLPKAS